jgi:hypothetical protein
MTQTFTVKRYGAYFRGWCQAFDVHEGLFNEQTGVQWLIAKHQVGFVLSADVRKVLLKELLRKDEVPTVRMQDDRVSVGEQSYTLTGEVDRRAIEAIRRILNGAKPCHLYLTSHFRYGTRERMLTLTNVEPLYILYKKIGDLVIAFD